MSTSLIMEYIPGNELYHLLNQMKCLDESAARFYAAEIFVALEDIHSLGIVYRDLKPENVMLDIHGHIKLIDFGLSKLCNFLDTGREIMCGSEGYISPEVTRGEISTFASDFYSLGVVIHEMLSGCLSSNSNRSLLTSSMKLPEIISKSARSLIRGLLSKDPAERIDSERIKEHKWFRGINWTDVRAKTMIPPFRSNIENPLKYDDILNVSTSEEESLEEEEI
jgi:serine/threonine protein kinase